LPVTGDCNATRACRSWPGRYRLLRRIADREAVVGVIGLGYVGPPLALRLAECGLPVLGFVPRHECTERPIRGREV
jgi:phosphoglycerate dehydrogenase-like enzyme